jgi:exodeoxyribonuclease VII small subunit
MAARHARICRQASSRPCALGVSPDAIPAIRGLGVDYADFTVERPAKILRPAARPLKIALLDQQKIAGLGNIDSSQATWVARLSPFHHADRLRPQEMRRLHKGIVDVLGRAIECCLDPAPNLRDPKWWFAGVDRPFACTTARARRASAAATESEERSQASDRLSGAARLPALDGGRKNGFEMNRTTETKPVEQKPAESSAKGGFEKSLLRLEEVVKRLEGTDLSLDEAMKLFEEGVKLSHDCQKQLEEAEGKVEILLRKADGKISPVPFEPEDESS